jgi:hypothetical protein
MPAPRLAARQPQVVRVLLAGGAMAWLVWAAMPAAPRVAT